MSGCEWGRYYRVTHSTGLIPNKTRISCRTQGACLYWISSDVLALGAVGNSTGCPLVLTADVIPRARGRQPPWLTPPVHSVCVPMLQSIVVGVLVLFLCSTGRPREEWDPTLWEIPLQPLPKKHKAHWDANGWEVQPH